MLGKFLSIAKHCYEARNFATAMQILGGLENVIVRQLPVKLDKNDSNFAFAFSLSQAKNIMFAILNTIYIISILLSLTVNSIYFI